jgi:hypothetical protein
MKKFLFILAALAMALGLGAASAGSEEVTDTAPQTEPAPEPDFVREDGSIDMSKFPEGIPVFDERGEIAGYVDADDASALPGLTPEEAARAQDAQTDAERHPVTVAEDGSEIEEVTPIRPDIDRPADRADG